MYDYLQFNSLLFDIRLAQTWNFAYEWDKSIGPKGTRPPVSVLWPQKWLSFAFVVLVGTKLVLLEDVPCVKFWLNGKKISTVIKRWANLGFFTHFRQLSRKFHYRLISRFSFPESSLHSASNEVQQVYLSMNSLGDNVRFASDDVIITLVSL